MFTSCKIPPPAVPWKARPMMSIFMLLEAAQMIDVTKYVPTAAIGIGFRPQMSDNFAHAVAAAAFAKRYAPPLRSSALIYSTEFRISRNKLTPMRILMRSVTGQKWLG